MIRLVTGPPGAGKTTYIDERSKPSDIVIDYDKIRGLTGSDEQARRFRALLEDSAGRHRGGDVWIARTLPDPADRARLVERLGVEDVIVLDVDEQTAKQRVLARDGNEQLFPAIEKWWAMNTPEIGKGEQMATDGNKENAGHQEDEKPKGVDSENQYPDDESFTGDVKKPVSEMTDDEKVGYWKGRSRSNEKLYKDMAKRAEELEEKAKNWDAYKASQEDPAAKERAEARREIFGARLEAAGAKNGIDLSKIAEHLSVDSFTDEHGKIDSELVSTFVSALKSEVTPKPQGFPGSPGDLEDPKKPDAGVKGDELFELLHGKK